MIQKISFLVVFVVFSVILVMACASEKAVQKATVAKELISAEPEKHAEVDFSISCMECHQEVTPEAYDAWKESSHGKMNFGCYMCHGDGTVTFASSPTVESCESCHTGHEACMINHADACYDCHDGHSMKIIKK